MNKRLPHTRLLMLCLLLSSSLFAQQKPHPHFRHYGTEHGLPSPEVYCAFEDSRGYMWFGTDNGASRFDGYTFKNYGPQEGLAGNVVFDIKEDGKGRIWFGTMSGLIYLLEGDTIMPYPYNSAIKSLQSQFKLGGLAHISDEGAAWLVLVDYGLLYISPKGETDSLRGKNPSSILSIYIEEAKKAEDIRSVLRYLGRDSISKWDAVHRRDAYFWEFHSKTRVFEKKFPYNKQNVGTPGGESQSQRLPSGEWIVIYSRQLHCIRDTQTVWTIPFFVDVTEIIVEEDGSLWFCTISKGLRRYEDLNALKSGQHDLFLPGISITNFLKTSKNEYWITSQEGVFHTPNMDISVYDSQFGFSEDFVSAVAFKDDQELFAGCNNGDIFHINTTEGKISHTFSSPYEQHNFDLWYDRKRKRLWSDGGYRHNHQWHPVSVWDYTNKKKFKQYYAHFKKMHMSSKDKLSGIFFSGFITIDLEKDSLTFSSSYYNSLREKVYSLYTDKHNRLWVGRKQGLYQVANEQFISPGINHPAFHHRVEDIHEYPDTTLVLGTKGYGVILWKDSSIVQITTQHGLASNMLEDVHVDENGILWAATLSGISKIKRRAGSAPEVRTFTTANGLPSNEIYQIKSYEGQVWLCTAGGLVRFKEPLRDTISEKPIVEVVKANNSLLAVNNPPRLLYHQNNLEFQFLAINYRMNGRIPYRYRLQPDAPWQYTQNRVANYPALPSGKYTFEVQAQNEDRYWSGSSTYAFTVLPPWWTSWWFRMLLGIGIATAGYGFYRYRIQQLKRANAIQQQMAALEKSALQAQMNPHFIFNCLNSIQNFILQNDKKKAVEYLSRFAKLVRHNLNASVQGQVTLEEEISLLDNYLALERERFNQRFEYEIEIAESLKGQHIQFPPLLIQPYVENAVIHGLSDKHGGGKIEICFSEKDGAILASIKDNGAGYRNSEQGHKEQRHKSVGMSITRKRLELLGADPDHSVQILSAGNGLPPETGTKVNILIHVKNNNVTSA